MDSPQGDWFDRNIHRWWLRYPIAAGLIWGAFAILQGNGTPEGKLWGPLICVVIAGLFAWEITLAGLAIGGVFLVGSWLAAVPVSVAIIIGALIIANSRNQ